MKLLKLLEQVIQELGDSIKGYDYQMDWGDMENILTNNGHNEYTFEDKNKIEYFVDIWNSAGYLSVEFSISRGNPTKSSHGESNFGDQYRVMGTIVNIIKDIIDSDPKGLIKGIEYNPNYKESEEEESWQASGNGNQNNQDPINQRDRLYRAYIQRAFPNRKVKFTNEGGTIIAHFPKNK